MKLYLLGIALLAGCTAASAQTQSGSSIGGNSPGVGGNVQPRPVAPTLPSTSTRSDSVGVQATSPRTPEESSVSTSGATAAPLPERSSGLCDTLTGQERRQCQREQASTGTAGTGSVGGAGGGLK
jgi:hypothetical protein